MSVKTNEDRIFRIAQLSEDYFGKDEVIFVGLKYDCNKSNWVAKVQLENNMSIYEAAPTSEDALKKLKNRIKKIIKRYDFV